MPFEALVEELERALILHASYATKWNQSRTAEMLQLKRDKLRYRMKLYQLQPENQPTSTRIGPTACHASPEPGRAPCRRRARRRLLGLAGAGGCAYSTAAVALPPHLKTIAIPQFENATNEYTLEQDITTAVVERFVADNHLRSSTSAPPTRCCKGRITHYDNSVFGISPQNLAQEYRVTIAVSVVFKDQVKNRELWHDDNLVKTANYYVQNVPGQEASTELDGRKNAIAKIADEILARSVQGW